MDFSRFKTVSKASSSAAYDQGLRSFMIQVYNYMALGLSLTGIVALFVANSPGLIRAIHGTPLSFVVMLAPLGLVLALGFKINSMKFSTARNLFYIYAAVMGLSLSYVFLVYTAESVARVFFITASVFGAMSLYGYTTKKDLTGMGSFMMMGLFGIIILSLVNIFLKSSGMQFVISLAALAIFIGLTAYDTQKIKQSYYMLGGTSDVAKKAGLMGALSLYIDFINIFIHLMHFMGERR
jgi:uncharacterized protein